MSVLIKGADMPKVCADCPCFYDNICCNALPYGEGAFSDHEGFDEYDPPFCETCSGGNSYEECEACMRRHEEEEEEDE